VIGPVRRCSVQGIRALCSIKEGPRRSTRALGGAALDVAEVEPIPPASPLWDAPNMIISPHIAGAGSTGYPQQKALFGQNLARFSAGEPLLNVCRARVEI
jgi:phosphoglycerate dehydrogenase-like enzyme